MNVLIVGKINHNNYGDILMVLFMAERIKANNGNVFLLGAFEFILPQLKAYNIEAKIIGITEIDSSIDFSIFTGGGYFAHNLVNGKKWCANWLKESYFIDAAKVMKNCNIPYYIYSVEVGPILNKQMREEVRVIFDEAKEVVCRNIGSVDYVKNILQFNKCEVGPDMVLSELSDFHNRHYKNYESLGLNVSCKDTLAIHVTDKYNGTNFIKRMFRRNIVRAVNSSENYKTVILFSDNEETTNLDSAFRYLEKNIEKTTITKRYSDVENLLALFNSFSSVITTKLHVGVSGFALNKSVLCFSDMPKTRRFYKENKFEKCLSGFYFSIDFLRYFKIKKFLNERKCQRVNVETNFYTKKLERVIKEM
ncbi:polysaccharide pyruvyl transferase family protein [Alteromonas australica]|uniref:polysaccharide pyruvyl transferase family protein n=1 Tax=Alteromonas australica TaxID=589873 RepID=UPI0023576502|nr:polysaccharide pyruvyl transferase family protein [Alteromonas australica]|tara:strand:- start:27395 stop:28486 length:1092 start_codon:yes stop_codon:yes gene_type:complete